MNFVQNVLLRGAMALAGSSTAHGLEIVNLSRSEVDALIFNRVARVLQLIQQYDASQLRRILADVRRIVVTPPGGAAGSYWASVKACVLGAEHLLQDSCESAAMTLVHEATHARLERAGIRYTSANRARIESICLRAEIAFGRKVPGTELLVEEAKHAMNTEWWTDDAHSERRRHHLTVIGCPAWLIRFGDRLLR